VAERLVSRTERQDVLRRAYSLLLARPIRTGPHSARTYPAGVQPGGESKEHKLLRERAEALDGLASVARELGLPRGRWPTIDEYQRVAPSLGVRYSHQQVIRRWGRWEDAGRMLVGQRITETLKQRSLRRATSGRSRNHETYLQGLRDWLNTSPLSTTEPDNAGWVKQENLVHEPDHLPYVGPRAVMAGLLLRWPWCVRVATRETTLEEAQEAHLRELTEASGELQLLATRGVALVLGIGGTHPHALTSQPGFPPHVATIGRARVWYRSDIEAHRDGVPVPRRKPDELTPKLANSADVSKALGMPPDSLISLIHRSYWHLVPPPTAQVSTALYWLREDLDRWLNEHPHRTAEARAQAELVRASRPTTSKRPAKKASPAPKKAKSSR
jgi:predicted DNA-binding transcriptional regulator AlpA